MPFQYQPFNTSPAIGSIAELMLRRGDIAASRAKEIAAAQARAQEISGQAWAGAAQGVGNAVSGAIQQATDPRRQMEQMQVGEAKQLQSGNAQVDAMMRGDQLPAGDAGPRQESYLTADGLFDIPKMNAALAQSGKAHLAPELLKRAESINASIQNHQATEQKAAQDLTLMYGDMAHGALKLAETGVPIPEAMDFAVQPGLATKRIDPAKYSQLRQQIGQLQPAQQAAALTTFMDAAAKLDKGETLAKDAEHVDRYGRTNASNIVSEPNKGDYTGPDGIRYHANGQPVTGNVMKPQTPPKSYQKSSVLLDGKPAEILTDPTPGGKVYDLSGGMIENAASRVKPIPAASLTIHNENAQAPDLPAWALDDSRPTGPEANKLDPKVRMTPNGLYQAALNNIATGQFPPLGRGTDEAAKATRTAIISKVGAIAAASGMDEPALRAFYKSNAASLAQQQKMQDSVQGFMATADKNAALLKKTLEKIPDTGSPLFNQPLRSFMQKVAGDPNLSQFATYLQSVQNEYGRIISQPNLAGQLTDSARHEAETLASGTATVPQLLASLDALQQEGSNRLLSVGETIQRIQQRMQIGPDGKTPPPAAKSNPFKK